MMQQKTKEQEAALTRESLVIFNDMKIRFPGKTNEEAELILEDVSIDEHNRGDRLSQRVPVGEQWRTALSAENVENAACTDNPS